MTRSRPQVLILPLAIAILGASAAGTADAQLSELIEREESDREADGRSSLLEGFGLAAEELPDQVIRLEYDGGWSGARYLTDILRGVPGAEVIRMSATESNVNVRGYNETPSSTTGVLGVVDGRQINDEFFGNVLWDATPLVLDDIERIEVLRGPSSFLYGPNAMHGLVDVVTRSPLDYDQDSLRVSLAAGSYRSTVGSLVYVRRPEGSRSGLKVRLGYDDLQEFEDRSQNARGQGHLEMRLGHELGEGQTLELTAGVSDQRQTTRIPVILGVVRADFRSEVEEAYLKANYEVLGLRVQLSWTAFESDSDPDQYYTPFHLDQDIVDLDLQYTTPPLGGNVITVGTGYRVASFDTSDADVADGRHRTDLFWGFFQDDVRVHDRLTVTFGARIDEHSKTGTRVSPRVATTFRIFPDHYLRGSIGFGYRNPALRELWFDMPISGPGVPAAVVLGNEDLDPERIRSFEIGYFGWPIEKLESEMRTRVLSPLSPIKIGVTGFYNRIDDLIEFVPDTSGSPVVTRARNVSDEEAFGLEFEGEWYLSEYFTVFGNYSYVIRRARDGDDRDRRTPRGKANAGVRVSGGGFRGRVWGHYFGKTRFDGLNVDDYFLLNGEVAYRFGGSFDGPEGVELFLQGMNILDHQHREHPEGDRIGALLMTGFRFTW